MRTIIPAELATKDLHQFIVGAIAPRPIAFASTIDEQGQLNIAPYSFFNAFSSNPPILVFSSNRRVKGNTTKDTLHNIEANGEVVINVVNYEIVRQMAIASVSYPAGVSEFEKSGLTPIPSEVVKPYRLKESPVQFECKVKEIVTLGEHGGAGHLIICDVLRIHIAENVIDEKGRIDPHKLDLVGRLGRAYYVRASGSALFTLHQDQEVIPIGFDALPLAIRQSKVLTGNDLGQLAGLLAFPTAEAIAAAKAAVTGLSEEALHQKAQALLAEERAEEALALLMAAGV
jgi:flavin reductase (DIM6/NTAB) family NADH-FMN oxidoreductase RutF